MSDDKRAAALRALDEVEPGMVLGLGTGSTAAFFIDALGGQVAKGLAVVGVPTSDATARQAAALGIPLARLDDVAEIDLTVDGADEFDGALRLIKGGGGALLREKLVAAASRRMIVVADASKQVEILGRFPLPVEIVPFGLPLILRRLAVVAREHGAAAAADLRRSADGGLFRTDAGNVIVDMRLGAIPEPEAMARDLKAVLGVVEHGLFCGLADVALIGAAARLERRAATPA